MTIVGWTRESVSTEIEQACNKIIEGMIAPGWYGEVIDNSLLTTIEAVRALARARKPYSELLEPHRTNVIRGIAVVGSRVVAGAPMTEPVPNPQRPRWWQRLLGRRNQDTQHHMYVSQYNREKVYHDVIVAILAHGEDGRNLGLLLRRVGTAWRIK